MGARGASTRRGRAGDGRVRRTDPARGGDPRGGREGERVVLGQGDRGRGREEAEGGDRRGGQVAPPPPRHPLAESRARLAAWSRALFPKSCAGARSGCSTRGSAGSPY